MWGREMRAGLAFVLASLLLGGAFRDWERSHKPRLADLVESLESKDRAARDRAGGVAPVPGLIPAGPGAAPSKQSASRAPSLAPARIDLNRATPVELERLPGIGPALAARIVADRQARGPYVSPESLLRVPGIGPRILARILPFLSPPASPADSGSPIAN